MPSTSFISLTKYDIVSVKLSASTARNILNTLESNTINFLKKPTSAKRKIHITNEVYTVSVSNERDP